LQLINVVRDNYYASFNSLEYFYTSHIEKDIANLTLEIDSLQSNFLNLKKYLQIIKNEDQGLILRNKILILECEDYIEKLNKC
jgi:hypothetical protein